MYVSILSCESGCNDGFFFKFGVFLVRWGGVGIMLCLSSSGFCCWFFFCFYCRRCFVSISIAGVNVIWGKHSIVASIKHIHVNTLSNKHLIQHKAMYIYILYLRVCTVRNVLDIYVKLFIHVFTKLKEIKINVCENKGINNSNAN